MELLRSNSRLGSLIILLDMVHTRMKVYKMNLEMCGLWNDLDFSLCTVLFVCHIVAISDGSEC